MPGATDSSSAGSTSARGHSVARRPTFGAGAPPGTHHLRARRWPYRYRCFGGDGTVGLEARPVFHEPGFRWGRPWISHGTMPDTRRLRGASLAIFSNCHPKHHRNPCSAQSRSGHFVPSRSTCCQRSSAICREDGAQRQGKQPGPIFRTSIGAGAGKPRAARDRWGQLTFTILRLYSALMAVLARFDRSRWDLVAPLGAGPEMLKSTIVRRKAV